MDASTIAGLAQILTSIQGLLSFVVSRGISRDEVFEIIAEADENGEEVSYGYIVSRLDLTDEVLDELIETYGDDLEQFEEEEGEEYEEEEEAA